MWDSTTINMILEGIVGTVYMSIVSTFFGYIFGLPMGVLLTISDKNGLKPNPILYKVLDAVSNVVRSVPFLILLILLIPFTRLVVGKSYGTTATIVPLVISAAKAMGASNTQIVFKVLLVEARTSLITNATIALGTVLGYSAMAGTVGGGGLGDIAVRYGYYRYQTDIMIVTVILLIVLFQIFQNTGMFIARKLNHRV